MKIDNYRSDPNFKYIICPARLSDSLYVTEIGKRVFRNDRITVPAYRDFYTIHILRRGDGKFCGVPFANGCGFTTFPHQRCWYQRGEDWEVYWVKFGGKSAASYLKGIGVTESGVLEFDDPGGIFLEMDAFLESPERAENATEIDFLKLLFFTMSTVRIPEGAIDRPSDYVHHAKNYIEENYDMDISVSSIASNLHISEKHLWRVFKNVVGISPKQYIIECRLRRAEELLRDFPDIKISEISASVGYGTPEAFLQVYRRRRGRPFRPSLSL